MFLPSKRRSKSPSTIFTWHHSMATGKIYKCLPHIFVLALTITDIKIYRFDLSKVGQGHVLQFSQWRHSMANVKMYTKASHIFLRYSHCFRDINIENCLPSKRSRSLRKIVAVTPFEGKCQNLQMTPTHFCASSQHFRDIHIWEVGRRPKRDVIRQRQKA